MHGSHAAVLACDGKGLASTIGKRGESQAYGYQEKSHCWHEGDAARIRWINTVGTGQTKSLASDGETFDIPARGMKRGAIRLLRRAPILVQYEFLQ